ncbi:unnamed protein product [Acanthoscelides obtectus]|uniref:VPS37 C-terminal domain-containing protein n=1 Tax=Acanthoscelides obtectus TaxID=200917 RepID=A0A9P0PS34_ACAOB|nr:unnamed protein product [Acanthoscelides obtectus]CAK1621472.1 Vacuolar protein sorting-associated protein 37A [Acanthoscelides obtectus]
MLPRLYKTDAEIRKYQINTLMVFNDNVREIYEGEEYEIGFTSGGNSFSLKVHLSRDFPNDKPKLKVYPVVHHHWVDSDGVIQSAPGLLSFNVHSSDLGRVVQAIIREFQRDPPPLASSISFTTTSTSINNGEVHQSSPLTYPLFTSPNPVFTSAHSRVSIPSYDPSFTYLAQHAQQSSYTQKTYAFPELSHMCIEELKFLNENVDRQNEFIDELPLIREQNKAMDNLAVQIEEMAASNLSKKGVLEQLRKDVDQKVDEVTELVLENEQLLASYQSLSDKYAPRNIQEELRKAARKMEGESEKVAENFLNGSIDVDNFVSNFIRTRMISQARKTKEEKLGQQLDQLERAGF